MIFPINSKTRFFQSVSFYSVLLSAKQYPV